MRTATLTLFFKTKRNIWSSLEKGNPAAGSPTATLLRLHPGADRTVVKGISFALRCNQLPWCDGRCVQDPGTYSPRRADPRLLQFQLHALELQSTIRLRHILGLAMSPSLLPIVSAIVTCVTHKGHEDLTSSPPSSSLSLAVLLKCPTKWWQLKVGVALVAGLNPTSHDTS